MEKPIKYVKITKVDYFMHLLSKLNECHDKALELGDGDTARAISVAELSLIHI